MRELLMIGVVFVAPIALGNLALLIHTLYRRNRS